MIGTETSHLPLEGKVALVTGSGRGIGKGIALELAKYGASVVINYAHSDSAALETVHEIKEMGGQALPLRADLTMVTAVTKMFQDAVDHFGRMDIVSGKPRI